MYVQTFYTIETKLQQFAIQNYSSILYTHGYTDGHTDRHTDTRTHEWVNRQADSSIPRKTFVFRGYS